jgi:hypothetical protein
MRERAMAYAAERLRAGAETWEIATELGVYEETVRRWMLGVGAESPAASAARDSAAAATGCRQRVGADSPAAPAAKGPDLSLIPLVVGGHQVDESRHRLRIDLQDGTRVHAWGLAVSDVLLAIQALRRGR